MKAVRRKRKYVQAPLKPGDDYGEAGVGEVVPKAQANLITSDVTMPEDVLRMHMPALDIDHACHLRQSETPGHYHLLIDVPMTWANYCKLLDVMVSVGILEQGYVNASKERGMTRLALKPWKGGQS